LTRPRQTYGRQCSQRDKGEHDEAEHLHGTATTEEFIALSERISGQDLSNFFRVWLYTAGKPTSW
jgi:aminopeptidase N